MIDIFHGVLDPIMLMKNAIKSRFHKVQMHGKTFPQVTMSIAADKCPREREPYQLSFSDKDLKGLETPPAMMHW